MTQTSKTDQQIAEELWRLAKKNSHPHIQAFIPEDFDTAVSRILAEVRTQEREACAKIADAEAGYWEHEFGRYDHQRHLCEKVAAAIRTRKETL